MQHNCDSSVLFLVSWQPSGFSVWFSLICLHMILFQHQHCDVHMSSSLIQNVNAFVRMASSLYSIYWLFLQWFPLLNLLLPWLCASWLHCCFCLSPIYWTMSKITSTCTLLIFAYIPGLEKLRYKHRYFKLSLPPPISPLPSVDILPFSLCWPSSPTLHPSVISPQTVGYLPVCTSPCSCFTLSLLSYMRWYVWLTSIFLSITRCIVCHVSIFLHSICFPVNSLSSSLRLAV